jgi:hypothetical protein
MTDSLIGGRGMNPLKMFDMDYYIYAMLASYLVIFITISSVVGTKRYCHNKNK